MFLSIILRHKHAAPTIANPSMEHIHPLFPVGEKVHGRHVADMRQEMT